MSVDNGIVVLPDGIPTRLRFSAIVIKDSQVKDKETGFFHTARRLSAQVTELDGKPVHEVFDTLSEKLQAVLSPYATDPDLNKKVFVITKTGKGYLTEYQVSVSQ